MPKKPEARSSGSRSTGSHDDPRFIAVARGHSRRKGIPIPEANPDWLPQARSWYNSLKLSGQSDFYEASDWATAVCAAQMFHDYLRTKSPGILAQFVRLTESLGATISDRKKSRIELEDPNPADADEEAADRAVNDWQLRLVKLWALIRRSRAARPEANSAHRPEEARRPPSPATFLSRRR